MHFFSMSPQEVRVLSNALNERFRGASFYWRPLSEQCGDRNQCKKQEEFYLIQHAGVTLHIGIEQPCLACVAHIVGLYTILRASTISHNVIGRTVLPFN